jgi:ribonuclease D
VELSKAQQSSDWGAADLSPAQLEYAASDVLYLHAAKARLDEMLEREGRTELARNVSTSCPAASALDLAGWDETDIFAHS